MFIKPFKVKSNNQLKGTERKKLCQEILAAYPTLTDDEVQSLIPKKEAISVMKITTHNGQLCKLYCVAKIPMFFQVDTLHLPLLPTIFTLWHHPNLLVVFTTRQPVISKLVCGADLMLPGVVIKEPVTLYSFGKLQKGTLVSVDTDDNKASVAVGITALSSEDMYMSGGYGKCIEILHVLGDMLCQLGKPPTRPNLGPSVNIDNNDDTSENVEDTRQASKVDDNTLIDTMSDLRVSNDNLAHESAGEENAEKNVEESIETETAEEPVEITETVLDPVQEMDNLLEYCFLKACKKSVKPVDLPMLVSNFFKNHLMASCPPDKSIDIKKSRYKKLSVFLAEMKAKGVINTSITKGVESLLSIKFDHPLVRRLVVLEEPTPVEPVVSNTAVVSECYKVTAHVVPILSKFGYEKGDVMKRAEIRKCFTDYVKLENLQDGNVWERKRRGQKETLWPLHPCFILSFSMFGCHKSKDRAFSTEVVGSKILKLNPQLAGIMKTKADQVTVTMEDGINKFIGRMTHMHEVTLAGNKLLHTGKLEPIDMRVTVRSGGKKVTLVNNLETFGINSKEFSKECQNIGASATITDEPGKKTPSVLVQGNQILYVYKLLTEKYQIKKTYIRGLEFAPKKPGAHKK